MSDHGGTSQRLSVPEAAAHLGLSVATVRRMIRDGRLQAETVERPQGIAYVVVLPTDQTDHAERSSTAQQVGTTARLNESPADAMAALIQATLAPIVAPLVAEQAALRQTVERQAEQLIEKAETIGRQGAELDQIRARLADVESPADSDRLHELARENATLAERLAAQKRLREAAMAHAAELEAKLEAAAARPPEPSAAEEVAELRAEHYRHTAELARADVTLAGQAASHARVSRQVRRLWIALAVAGALAIVGLVAPAWVR